MQLKSKWVHIIEYYTILYHTLKDLYGWCIVVGIVKNTACPCHTFFVSPHKMSSILSSLQLLLMLLNIQQMKQLTTSIPSSTYIWHSIHQLKNGFLSFFNFHFSFLNCTIINSFLQYLLYTVKMFSRGNSHIYFR